LSFSTRPVFSRPERLGKGLRVTVGIFRRILAAVSGAVLGGVFRTILRTVLGGVFRTIFRTVQGRVFRTVFRTVLRRVS